MVLTLRKTVIGGRTAPGDYVVLENGRVIGRILAGAGPNNQPRWKWYININDASRIANGWESTFDGAKAAFKASWEHSKPLPPE